MRSELQITSRNINDKYKKIAIRFTSKTNLLRVWKPAYVKKKNGDT